MANLRHLRANLTIDNGFGKLTSLRELSSINISKDTNVRELGNMPKQLHGELVIRGLENVTNLQDAGEGILKDKVHINQLRLAREDETKFMTEEVLNVLSCPPNITDLSIDGYDGRSLSWMEWRDSNVMRSLSMLHIDCCHGPTLLKVDAFVSLKSLWIGECSNLTTISFGATVERLEVMSCVKLNRMESKSTSSLKTSSLQSCNVLKSLMDLQGIDSLKYLSVVGCPELMIVEASSPSSLLRFHTDNVVLFTKVFEYNNLVRMEEMIIRDFGFEHFSESVVNNWHKLTLLQYLSIRRCGNLKSLSPEFQNLSSLQHLRIINCPQLQLLSTDGLPLSLKSLEVYHSPKLSEQCRVDSEHWNKFKHIPHIRLSVPM